MFCFAFPLGAAPAGACRSATAEGLSLIHIFLQHWDDKERRQHRRSVGANLQRTADEQKHHRQRTQHPAQRNFLAFRLAHSPTSLPILVHYTLFCFTLQEIAGYFAQSGVGALDFISCFWQGTGYYTILW